MNSNFFSIGALAFSVLTAIILCSKSLEVSSGTISMNLIAEITTIPNGRRGRDFAYLDDSSVETRYQNKTILFVFAGRRNRLEIQLLYLERLIEDGDIDFVHYHHCQPSSQDEEWLATLPERYPAGWFELRDGGNLTMRDNYNEFNYVFNSYKRPEYATSTFVKIDDDVVLLPLNGAITRAIEYNRNHPEIAWTSGLVFNHPIFDNFMQKDGVLPGPTPSLNFSVIPSLGGIVGSPDRDHYKQRGQATFRGLHEFVLQNYVHIFNDLSGVYVVPPDWRVCINFMIFTHAQLLPWEFKHNSMDEIDLKVYTYQAKKSVHVFKGAAAAHFSYGKQLGARVVDRGLLGRYRELACLLTARAESGTNNDDDHDFCNIGTTLSTD